MSKINPPFTIVGPKLPCLINFSMVIAVNSFVKIRPAPNRKVYVMWFDQPICDAAGGLLYFDDEDEAREFMETRDDEELLGAFAS